MMNDEDEVLHLTMENAALKFSTYCRAIGWKYADGSDPGDYHTALGCIRRAVEESMKRSRGSFVETGLLRVEYQPKEKETWKLRIFIDLAGCDPSSAAE